MATNKIFAEDTRTNRAAVVPEGTKSGDFLLVDGVPAVAITDRGDATREYPFGAYGTLTLPSGGVSLEADEASVATTGTWELPVTGVNGDTAQGVKVYYKAASGGDSAELVLTASGNTLFGITDYPIGYARTDGIAPVRIGAPN